MSYTLIVVDMQARFSAANNRRVREHCKQEIDKAMDKGAPIIFLEYVGFGPTIPSLVRLTDDYERVFISRKNDDDGSREASKIIKSNRLPSRTIKVCGVNTDCCVASTIYGLANKMKSAKLEVIANACHSYLDHEAGLKDIEKRGVIVRK